MEILLSVGCILAFLLGAKIGRDNGVESTLSFLREKVHAGMAPYSVFQKAYGLSGMYLSNVSPKLKDMPLVVISSANFLELIALQKASIDATQDEIEGLMTQLANNYLIENGMSLEEVKTFQRYFPREAIKFTFPRRLNTKADNRDDEVTSSEDFYTQFDLRMLLQALKPINQPNENGSGGPEQLNEDSIVAWFEADARKLLLAALADRLGLGETVTEADIKRLQQMASQTRDSLRKLGGGKDGQIFDDRVKNALNWALDSTDSGGNMTKELRNKLNARESGSKLFLSGRDDFSSSGE